jgi:DNA-binding NarL/FixJ family response regulator
MTQTAAIPQRRLRILVADDHPLILGAVRRAFEQGNEFEIVAEVTSGAAVVPQVARTRPDVVLLDVNMPGIDGATCLERLRANHPDLDVVMFSASRDPATVERVRKAGARGFVVKTLGSAELATIICELLEGSEFRVVDDGPVDRSRASDLSERELAALEALARGLSNKAIGRELWVSEQTVKFHLTNIYRKLGVDTRTQAARYAYENGLVGD